MPDDNTDGLAALVAENSASEFLNDRFLELGVPANTALMMAESKVLTRRIKVQGHKAFLTTLDEQSREVLIPLSDPRFRETLAREYPETFKVAETAHDMIRGALESTSLTKRGELVKAIGADAANSHARRFGLHGIHDLRAGTAPSDFSNADGAAPAVVEQKPKPVAFDDPFAFGAGNTDGSGRYTSKALMAQHNLVRSDPARAAALAKKHGVAIGASRVARPVAA